MQAIYRYILAPCTKFKQDFFYSGVEANTLVYNVISAKLLTLTPKPNYWLITSLTSHLK